MTAIGCPNSKKSLLRLAAALAIVAASCPAIAADNTGADELAARRQKIAEMSEVERDLLNQQHAKFLAMSPSQQEAMRRLHEEVEADARVDGLGAVVRNYQAWLKTLSPWERAEIRVETNPEKRISLIRRIKEQEEIGPEQPVTAQGPPRQSPDENDPRRRRVRIHLPEADFHRIIDVIADSLMLSKDEQNALPKLPAHRHIQILLKALERHRPGEGQQPRERWPSDELMIRMIAAISDGPARERLEHPEASAEQRRWFLRSQLFGAVWREAAEEMEKRRPTDEQMRAYFLTLESEDRDKLMRQWSDDGHRHRLVWRYLGEKGDAFARDLVHLQRLLSPRFGRNDGRPPGAERPRRGRPDGDDRDRFPRQPPPRRDVPPPRPEPEGEKVPAK